MRVMLATICLNEMEWLPKLFAQHKDWPGLVGWCFVEGADPTYARTNPGMVDKLGHSVDGTTQYLLSISGGSTIYIPQGYSTGGDDNGPLDQRKRVFRNAYLRLADHFKPDVIVQLDADEFYTREDQEYINVEVAATIKDYDSWMFKQRHIWNPWSQDESNEQKTGRIFCMIPPTFSQEVVGGYWQVPHTRVWRYIPGMRHISNHNWPEVNGRFLTRKILRCDLMTQGVVPQCVHMGYASSLRNRKAKHDYYKARGEGGELGRLGAKRRMYLDCRDAYERWKPGDELPHGAKVIRYEGPVPECFR